jgi:hypothetical protein
MQTSLRQIIDLTKSSKFEPMPGFYEFSTFSEILIESGHWLKFTAFCEVDYPRQAWWSLRAHWRSSGISLFKPSQFLCDLTHRPFSSWRDLVICAVDASQSAYRSDCSFKNPLFPSRKHPVQFSLVFALLGSCMSPPSWLFSHKSFFKFWLSSMFNEDTALHSRSPWNWWIFYRVSSVMMTNSFRDIYWPCDRNIEMNDWSSCRLM